MRQVTQQHGCHCELYETSIVVLTSKLWLFTLHTYKPQKGGCNHCCGCKLGSYLSSFLRVVVGVVCESFFHVDDHIIQFQFWLTYLTLFLNSAHYS